MGIGIGTDGRRRTMIMERERERRDDTSRRDEDRRSEDARRESIATTTPTRDEPHDVGVDVVVGQYDGRRCRPSRTKGGDSGEDANDWISLYVYNV